MSEEQKLVEFFRSPEGDQLGRDGDYDHLTPAETAIRAMRVLSGQLRMAETVEIPELKRQLAAEKERADRFKTEHEDACKLVAQMHYAATGLIIGPKRGVVEDIADLRDAWLAEKQRADAAIASWNEERERAEREGKRVIAEKERTELAVAMAWREAADEVKALTYAARKQTAEREGFLAACDSAELDGFRLGIGRAVEDILAKLPAATLAQLEEMERNDRRYRWLRENGGETYAESASTPTGMKPAIYMRLPSMNESGQFILHGAAADVNIDAAIDASAGKYERIAGATGEYHATPDAADCKPTGNFTMTLKEPKK